MLSLLQRRPLLPDNSAEWVFDAFYWALANFDHQEFFQRSRLVQPSNKFFPGRVDSVHAKTDSIFQYTLSYCGLKRWPIALQQPQQFQALAPEPLGLPEIRRDSEQTESSLEHGETPAPRLFLSYDPQQTRQPQDLAAGFAQQLAQHMAIQQSTLPPGGRDFFYEGAELLSVFMGFGVLMANTAYSFKGGCGSCNNPRANRQAKLSQDEIVFALALYCRLKGIANSEATGNLKKHLRSSYRKAVKQIEQQPEQLQRLQAFDRR